MITFERICGTLTVILIAALMFAACSEDADGDTSKIDREDSGSEDVVGSVEILQGHMYHCFRYAGHQYKGGIWCQEIVPVVTTTAPS